MNQVYRDPFFFILSFAALVVIINLISPFFDADPTPILQEAEKQYKLGEQSNERAVRKEAFNHSLKSLLSLEEQYSPTYSNGKFYYDVGNAFFQLREFPEAILYYERSANLRPRDTNVADSLLLAQKKLGIPENETPSAFKQLFFFHHFLSIPEKLQLFVFLEAVAFGLFSAFLWTSPSFWSRIWLYRVGAIFVACCAVLLLSLGFNYYISPVEAVVMQSSNLYRDAGQQYAKVGDQPVSSGVKVKVLDSAFSGKWLKVQTPDGSVGFISSEALKVI